MTPEVEETLTPDSQKSTLDKASETLTDAADKIAGMVQPGAFSPPDCSSRPRPNAFLGDSKSTTQKLSDEAQSGHNETSKGLLEQAQEVAANALSSASKAAAGMSEMPKAIPTLSLLTSAQILPAPLLVKRSRWRELGCRRHVQHERILYLPAGWLWGFRNSFTREIFDIPALRHEKVDSFSIVTLRNGLQ